MLIVCIFMFVIIPLTLVGAVVGRNVSGTIELPCRANPFPRPTPEKKWFVVVLLPKNIGTLTV